jgi:hypothetical protein
VRRLARATLATVVLLVLLGGTPLVLALSAGNPLQGWDGLQAGDLSGAVLLDVLAAVGWIAWASFAWAVLGELAAAPTSGAPRPHLPVLVPGMQHLAHSLVTAAFLLLPSTGAVLHPAPAAHTSPATISLHLAATAAGITAARPADATTPDPPPGHRTAMHRADSDSDEPALSALTSSEFTRGAGVGLVAGISLRELARLRRRQWRHRRPGRAVAATPTEVISTEKALLRRGRDQVSDTDRIQVLAAHAGTADAAMTPARGQAPWDAFCDAAGAPLPELTLSDEAAPQAGSSALTVVAARVGVDGDSGTPANSGTASPGTGDPAGQGTGTDRPPEHRRPSTVGLSVLSQPATRLLTVSASTARDVAVLAPQVHDRIRRLVGQADPGLDDDLVAWHEQATHRPRLSVLGPIRVRAAGHLPSPRPRLAWHTEVLSYLGAHPRGVTTEQFGTDLWPDDPDILTKPKLRQAIHVVRDWLGTNPHTGRAYLPRTPPGAGGTLFRVEELLSDGELFRRLRLRGVTHGPQGIHDLETALTLVTGPPYDPAQRRRDGYSWLIDTPVDAEYTAMIIDVAHLVATHHLAAGRPDLAAAAAHVSLSAGSRDDIPLLDLVAACDSGGNHGEAHHWIQQILTAHDADIEEDLPPRTAEILHRRRWHRAG